MVIAIVGATGLVGRTFLKVLEEENIEIDQLYLYASSRSAGKELLFKDKKYVVLELNEDNIKDKHIDFALFSAGGETSLYFAKVFTKYGTVVVDNSSAWRMDDLVPLVVPEVNLDHIHDELLIANPNCSTIQSVLPLKVLDDHFTLKSVNYTTFQAVSGSGVKGIEDLERTRNGLHPTNYPHPIFNNVLPHIDSFLENGYTKEEIKMIFETRKILSNNELPVTATCVRVPVENSHSVEIYVELEKEFSVKEVRKLLNEFDGITVLDDPQNNVYPLAANAKGTNDVFVGRIRKDLNNPQKLHLFCVADNIRKGAALNAVQIVKALMKRSETNV
jgi:aspartate-semialdehyde dehydrogenase